MSSSLSQIESFEASYFGPGAPAQGSRIPIRMTIAGLTLRPGGPMEEIVSFEAFRVTAGGFNHDQITLTWTIDGAVRSLVLSDRRAKEAFLSLAPPFTRAAADAVAKSDGIRSKGDAARLDPPRIFSSPSPPSGAGALVAVGRDRRVQKISLASEKKLGDLIYAQTEAGLTLLPEGTTTQAIEEIGDRLTKEAPYPFHWHVADDPTVNAFAIPGGHIVIFTGLIRAADSAEEVAGVLAHEAEHVLQRHSLKGIVDQLGWQVVLTLLLSEWGGQAGGQIGDAAAQLQRLRFGRDQESEADLKALTLLKGAKIDPNGMPTFFHRLAKEEGTSIPLLSTHPPSANRAKRSKTKSKSSAPGRANRFPTMGRRLKETDKRSRIQSSVLL